MSKEKVLYAFAVDTTLPRGDSTHVKEFLAALALLSKDHVVITRDQTRNDSFGSGKLTQILLFRLRLLLRYLRADVRVVYLRWFPGICLDLLLMRLLGKRCIVELNAVISEEDIDLGRPLFIRFLHRMDERAVMRFATDVVAVTPEIKEYYRRTSGKGNIHHIDNAVNTDLFDPAATQPAEELKALGASKFIIGFVGSLSPWQDFSTFLEAVALLKDRPGQEDVLAVIVGSGAEERTLRDLIASLRLEDRVVMTGNVSYERIPSYIRSFSIGIAPLKGSRSKNTGSSAIKVFEYLAMNIPVVLAEVGAFSNMVVRNGVGLAYTMGDSRDLADKIHVMRSQISGRTAGGFRGREIVVKDHSWGSTVRAVLKIVHRS